MKYEISKAIKILLRDMLAVIETTPPDPTDYISLLNYIAHLELKQEHTYLTELIKCPETFLEKFKKRCLWRMENPDRCLSFTACPDSLVNQLYFNMTQLLFAPETLTALLSIIAPGIKVQIFIAIQEHHEYSVTKDQLKMPTFFLRYTHDLPELDKAPTFESLKYFVFTDESVFDMRSLCLYPLKQHVLIHRLLQEEEPKLAQAIYSFNDHFQLLSTDMSTYSNQGVTPRRVLEDLVLGFKFGGSSYSGSKYASIIADRVRNRFYGYYNHLPDAIKTSFRQLNYGELSIGDVIDKEVDKGTCVETAAGHIKDILAANPRSMLDSPTKLSFLELNTLEKKYKFKHRDLGLDSVRSTQVVYSLPRELALSAITLLSIETKEELIFLLISFPTSCYQLLLDALHINEKLMISWISQILEAKILNIEQRQSIAQAIMPLLKVSSDCFIELILQTNDSVFIDAALKLISHDDLLVQLDLLKEACGFIYVFKSIPEELYPDCWQLLKTFDDLKIVYYVGLILRSNMLNEDQHRVFAQNFLPILLSKMEKNIPLFWEFVAQIKDSIIIKEAFAISSSSERKILIEQYSWNHWCRIIPHSAQELHVLFWSLFVSEKASKKITELLSKFRQSGILSIQIRQLIAKMITPMMLKYDEVNYLNTVIEMEDPIFIFEAYSSIPKDKLLNSLLVIFRNKQRVEHIIKFIPLSQLMSLVNLNQRLSLIKIITDDFKQPIYYYNLVISFKEVLASFPKNQRLSLIQKSGIPRNEVDLELCALVPEYHRLAFLKWAKSYKKKPNWTFLFEEDTARVDGLKDSFVPDLLKLLILVEQNNVYGSCDLLRVVHISQSFDEIKFKISKNMDWVADRLSIDLFPLLPFIKRQECLNYKWYKHSILCYLEDEIDHLPKASSLRQKLKEIEFEIKNNEHTLGELHASVIKLKDIVRIQTGWIGFFKCNCTRETAQYNKLLGLFEPVDLRFNLGLKNNMS